MENFDIEQLERKNIYRTPDDLFALLQENVLKHTVGAEIKPLITERPAAKNTNWWYAAAAALIMLFGLGAYFGLNNSGHEDTVAKETPKPEPVVKADATANQPVMAIAETKVMEPVMTETPYIKEIAHPKIAAKAELAVVHPKVVAKTTKQKAATIVKAVSAPAQVTEDILASLSKEEIASLARETEDDVYLELYN